MERTGAAEARNLYLNSRPCRRAESIPRGLPDSNLFVELELPVIESAGQVLERHPLRAYDSVQLASALVAARTLADAALPQPVFLSADDNLLLVAQTQGLLIDSPNLHP